MRNRLTMVLLILCVLTIVSWWVGHPRAAGTVEPSVLITIGVLVMALVKARLIIRHFMEVRTAPPALRQFTDAWLIALFGSILVIYLW
jgi:cytochrome b561